MGNVVPINRAQRRQYAAQKRAAAGTPHQCVVEQSRQAGRVPHPVPLAYPFFHDLHRALGERRCAQCPRCSALKAAARQLLEAGRPASAVDPLPDVVVTLTRWQMLLEAERDKLRP